MANLEMRLLPPPQRARLLKNVQKRIPIRYLQIRLPLLPQRASLFKNVQKINPQDKAAQLYLDRCDHMKKNPPKGDWDGVWVMTSK